MAGMFVFFNSAFYVYLQFLLSSNTLKLQREEIHNEANSLEYIKNVLVDLPVLDMYLRLEIIQQFLPQSLCLQIHELLQRKPAGRKAQSLDWSNYTPPPNHYHDLFNRSYTSIVIIVWSQSHSTCSTYLYWGNWQTTAPAGIPLLS